LAPEIFTTCAHLAMSSRRYCPNSSVLIFIGAAPMHMSTEEFGHYLREDIAKWANIVKISGAKVD
jgi:hypothetical protein